MIEFLTGFVDLFVHLDKHLGQIIQEYGTLTYLILFCVVFCETGLVITPFLPGDSLLFAAGTFAGLGHLDLSVLLTVLYLAPVCGDSTNYWIGRFVGPRVFRKNSSRLLNREHLERTHRFYEKHGGTAVIIGRFMPIFRTFVPFVAGIASMNYLRFVIFSVVGTFLWVFSFVLAGYFFGNVPLVKNNFSIAVLGIIAISLLPGIIHFLKARREKR